MATMRFISVLMAGLLAMTLFAAVASAQGVTVVTGRVTVGGSPSAAGQAVTVSLADGTAIGTGTTGAGGLAADQYRVDIQATSTLEGKTASVTAAGVALTAPATFAFSSNRVFTINLSGSVAAPVPTPDLRGPAGPPGADGSTGKAGSIGIPGAPGRIGAAGADGAAGAEGAAGAAGPAGPAGPSGTAGTDATGGSLPMVGLILAVVALALAGYAAFMKKASA